MSKKPSGNQIRQDFLDFFVEQRHTVVPSASLVPGGDATQYTLDGWATPEANGTWTIGDKASVLVPSDERPGDDVRLVVYAEAFLPSAGSVLSTRVLVDGEFVGTMRFTGAPKEKEQAFLLPASLVRQLGTVVQVDFELRRRDFLHAPRGRIPAAVT